MSLKSSQKSVYKFSVACHPQTSLFVPTKDHNNMLLRSSSTPILNSWLKSPEPEFQPHHRTRSVSLSTSIDDQTRKLINQALLELNMKKEVQKAKKNKKTVIPPHPLDNKHQRKEDGQEVVGGESSLLSTVEKLFSSSGLGEKVVEGDDHEFDMQTDAVGGGIGGEGGKICNGGGGSDGGSGGGGGAGGSGFFESSSRGSDSTDAYYRKMIEADPRNALLLGNYAKFLREVMGNLAKAEEYCERAILTNPNDGNVLALYGDLIWQNREDAPRAQTYFDQAVKTAPDDCYVLASYARFLWDTEEEEDDEAEEEAEETEKRQNEIGRGQLPPNIFHEAPYHPPITAAS